jgi:hypothetical protein
VATTVFGILIIVFGTPFPLPFVLHKIFWTVVLAIIFGTIGLMSFFIYPALKPKAVEPGLAENPLSGFLEGPFGRTLRLFVGLAVILSVCSFSKGMEAALTDTAYYVLDQEGQELVVLRLYGDRAVVAPLDRKTKLVDPKFNILKVPDGLKQPLRMESLGPLRPKVISPPARQGGAAGN